MLNGFDGLLMSAAWTIPLSTVCLFLPLKSLSVAAAISLSSF
jgi:hypothetical protein